MVSNLLNLTESSRGINIKSTYGVGDIFGPTSLGTYETKMAARNVKCSILTTLWKNRDCDVCVLWKVTEPMTLKETFSR